MRKGEQARDEMVKDINGHILRDGVEVRSVRRRGECILSIGAECGR